MLTTRYKANWASIVRSKTLFLATAISLLCGAAQAQWLLLDDFESATAGAVVDLTNSATVTWEGGALHQSVVDSGDASNQVLQVLGDQGGQRLRANFTDSANNIAAGTVGTVFYRFRTADTTTTGGAVDSVVGLTDNALISSFNFKCGLRMVSSPVVNNLDVRTNDAGGTSGYQQIDGLASNTWYSMWIVADNTSATAGTFKLYLQSDTDSNYAAQTQLATSGTGDDVFDFRVNGATDIVNVYFRTGGGGAAGSELYYDDIYLNNSAEDLTDPTATSGTCGDVNMDGAVDFLDITPFIALLSSGGFQAEADCDPNGVVDFLDIAPFIVVLSGG